MTAFRIDRAIEILKQTPATIEAMLGGLSAEWTAGGVNEASWAPFDIVGHLIHGDETDWMPRAEIILAQGENRTFVPFDRLAQFENSNGKTLGQLLDTFKNLRAANLDRLALWDLSEEQLELKGMHPELGEVTLRQLLATWAVHDLNHVKQISEALADKYAGEVGPWKAYLSILK